MQSRYFSVGSVVPWARAGVGAVATQAAGVAAFGALALEELERGASPEEALASVLAGRRRPGDAPARDRHRRRPRRRLYRCAVPRLGRTSHRRRFCRAGQHPRRPGRGRRDGAGLRGDGGLARRPTGRSAGGGPGGGWRQARTAVCGGRRRTRRSAPGRSRRHRPRLRPSRRGSRRADRRAAAPRRPVDLRGRPSGARTRSTSAATAFARPTPCAPPLTRGEEPGLLYNLACYESLAGRKEPAIAGLRRAIELDPTFRELARDDTDFDPIRTEISEL